MKKMIRKFLGLPSQEEINTLNSSLVVMTNQYRESVNTMEKVRDDMGSLKGNMKNLYVSLEQDIKNVKMNVKAIKPILKVEDPEAVAFIKGILSKHDHSIRTQQSFLETKMHELAKIESTIRDSAQKADMALSEAQLASAKINNVLNGLGFTDEKSFKDNNAYLKLRELIENTVLEKSNQA